MSRQCAGAAIIVPSVRRRARMQEMTKEQRRCPAYKKSPVRASPWHYLGLYALNSCTMYMQFYHANHVSNGTIALACGGRAVTIPS
jgi:hypothetical protein